MATNGQQEDVIENMNSEGIELDDVEKKDPVSKGVNGHAKANETAIHVHGNKDAEAKPLLPKIFIALLVVLLIAVIALSFVLYRLDKDIDANRKKLSNDEHFTSDLPKKVKQAIKDIETHKGEIQSAKEKITSQGNKINAQEGKIRTQGDEIKSSNEKITSQGTKITSQGTKIKTQEDRIKSQDTKIKTQEDKIKTQEEQIKAQDKLTKSHTELIQTLTTNLQSLTNKVHDGDYLKKISQVSKKVDNVTTAQQTTAEGLGDLKGTVETNKASSDTGLNVLKTHVESVKTNITQSIDGVKETVSSISTNVSDLTTIAKGNLKKIGDLGTKVTVNDLSAKEGLKNVSQELTNKITDATTKIDLSEQRVAKVETQTAQLSTNISAVESKLSDQVSSIAATVGNITMIASGNKDNVAHLKDFVNEMHLHLQINATVKDNIGLSFERLLKLLGKKDHVSEPPVVVTLLTKQKSDFDSKKKIWGLEDYDIIIKFTDVEALKGKKPLTTIRKVDAIYNTFSNKYETTWNITFKDVIRLTKPSDIKAMKVESLPSNSDEIPVLAKIEHMFQKFNNSYREEWGIEFKDIIGITTNLDFKVTDDNIPVLEKVNNWCVKNFTSVWGEGSFKSLFKAFKNLDDNKTEQFTVAMKRVVQKGILNFLPAAFESKNNQLNVAGYVEVLVEKDQWKKSEHNTTSRGTINLDSFLGGAPNVVCILGGYSSGMLIGKPKQSPIDRTNMPTLINAMSCKNGETNLGKCTYELTTNTTIAWIHTKDAAITCVLIS